MSPSPQQLLARWEDMPQKKRVAVLNLTAVVLLFLGYQNFLRPQTQRLNTVRKEWRNLNTQMTTLQKELPNLEEESAKLQLQAEEIRRVQVELEEIEGNLPADGELGVLLGELVQQGSDLGVVFESVKQREKKSSDLPEVAVEMTFSCSYEGLVNYMRRVEKLTPYLTIVQLEILVPNQPSGDRVNTKMTLMTPLRLEGALISSPFTLATPPSDKVFLPRSPFIVQEVPVDDSWKQELQVTGITFRGAAGSTAIINDKVMQVGDTIEDLTVQQISRSEVVFTDGEDSFAIPLGQ